MKTHAKKITLSFLFVLFLLVNTKLKAQAYYPTDYTATQAHAAWFTGASFGMGNIYTYGFCFAYDAVSPLAQGYQGSVYVYHYLPGSFTGAPWDVTFAELAITLPNTSDWYESALSVESWADTIYNLDPTNPDYIATKQFWYGYAEFLKWAAMNPELLLLQPGTGM